MVTVTLYFLVGVKSMLPSLFSGGFSGGWPAGFAGGLAAGAGAACAAGFATGGFGATWRGAEATRLSCAFCAALHSPHRKLPVLLPVGESCGTACLLHKGISQFAHFATAAWPQALFFNSPVSTAHVSIVSPFPLR